MKVLLTVFFLLFLTSVYAQSGSTAGNQYEYRYLIDMPAAGILKKGVVSVSTDVMPGGTVMGRMEVGVFNNMSIGISYGGANIIGTGSPKWYKLPAANFRFRVMDETTTMPYLTVGFDSQGKGEYIDSTGRYAVKSPGLFLAGSKDFLVAGYMSLHATLNYSFEKEDGDNFVSLKVGAEKTISDNISVLADYDFGFNDNSPKSLGKGTGYMNFGIRWYVSTEFTLGLDFRDILQNKRWSPGAADRAIKLEYSRPI